MREAFVVVGGILSVPESRIKTHGDRREVLAACREALRPGERVRVPWRFDRHGATRSEALAYCVRREDRWVENARKRHYAIDIVREAAHMGFRVCGWEAGGLELERTDLATPPHFGSRIAIDAVRAWSALTRAEAWRRFLGPREAIARARARGNTRTAGDATRRAWLSDLVFALDLFFPGGPNCYRRVLAESSLDAGAATDEIALGLDPASSGHAWLVPKSEAVAREVPAAPPVLNRV